MLMLTLGTTRINTLVDKDIIRDLHLRDLHLKDLHLKDLLLRDLHLKDPHLKDPLLLMDLLLRDHHPRHPGILLQDSLTSTKDLITM